MCGIAGFVDRRGVLRDPVLALQAMGTAIAHRGPDGAGEFFDGTTGVGLAHRRLAIIDLSEAGAQPMHSGCGRWVVVLNGEIYNYRELRQELSAAGHVRWRSESDTEVLLAAVEHWGVRETLHRINGMFAFALYDRRERTLVLARDRFGEKPLYYGWQDSVFCFGSELKALRAMPGWRATIDRDAVGHLLRFAYVPATGSIYRGIRKLAAGCFVRMDVASPREQDPGVETYWSPLEVAARSRSEPLRAPDAELVEQVERGVDRAVRLRMHADVPLGAFLSGGIDSSIVVASMQAQSGRPVRTFSIGFDESGFDESGHARAVAAHLGTDHTELRVGSKQALAVVPDLAGLYDEPFADSSQIPTLLVARLARTHVTVALSGDGGDELFGGYNRHAWAPAIWRRIAPIPLPVRRAAGRLMLSVPAARWDRLAERVGALMPVARQRLPGLKIHKLAGVLDVSGPEELYQRLASFWHGPLLPVRNPSAGDVLMLRPQDWPKGFTAAETMMAVDTAAYLPDDILVKVDRATMSASLEGRVPLLDPELFRLAWRLPMDARIRDGVGKWVLRQALYRRVPAALVERPKMGFGLPIAEWLRGALRDWAETLLSPASLASSGLLEVAVIRAAWADYLAGRASNEYHLWNVLMFQSWLAHEARRP